MTYKELRKKLKEEFKQLTATHTELKRKYKGGGVGSEIRIKHIAYSLFKGNAFNRIEGKWKDPNNPENQWIKDKAFELYNSYMAQLPKDPIQLEL